MDMVTRSILLAFVSVEFLTSALRLGVVSLLLGAGSSLVLAPLLLSRRLRSLFTAVAPGGHWIGAYVLIMTMIGGGEIWLFALTLNVLQIELTDPTTLVLAASVVLFLIYIVVLFLVPISVLPRLADWDENGYDRRTIGLIGASVLWYHAGMILVSPYAFDVLSGLPFL